MPAFFIIISSGQNPVKLYWNKLSPTNIGINKQYGCMKKPARLPRNVNDPAISFIAFYTFILITSFNFNYNK